MPKAKRDWSTKTQVGTYDVEWTSKRKKFRTRIAAGSDADAARHGRQVCHPGSHATIEVHFRGSHYDWIAGTHASNGDFYKAESGTQRDPWLATAYPSREKAEEAARALPFGFACLRHEADASAAV